MINLTNSGILASYLFFPLMKLITLNCLSLSLNYKLHICPIHGGMHTAYLSTQNVIDPKTYIY